MYLGLITGPAFGGFLGIVVLVGAIAGAEHALTLNSLAFCVGLGAFIGVFFVGLGYFERWRQRHYGHYPTHAQDRPGNRA
ncbi:hypothetical protein ACIBKY_54210 [Nonomuraea sp. NPDC050394]|uniref:hypothetical protein n=1 Tax=Nonomuraea sp. NPDC050394 TaxID=3364363 RepID=UPI0037898BF6